MGRLAGHDAFDLELVDLRHHPLPFFDGKSAGADRPRLCRRGGRPLQRGRRSGRRLRAAHR
jgi:hypothetical protein